MTTNIGNLNPLNEDKFIEEFNTLDESAREERIRTLTKERNEVLDSNRKLFERAKEAEGFKKDEEGNWIKTIEKEPKAKSSVKSDEELLKRLDTMALKMAGITADDEVELYNKWKEDTGREADAIVGNKIFLAELTDLRTAKANAAATSNVKGESGTSGEKDADYYIARSTKDAEGNPIFSEDLPNDYKLRAAIVEKMISSSKSNKQFYNQ